MASAANGSVDDFYQELHLVGGDQGQGHANTDLKTVLSALLADVLPFVAHKAVDSLAEKILNVKDGDLDQVEVNLHRELPAVLANLRQTRQSSQIETDLTGFKSSTPNNEVGPFASDIHLRRCESLIATVMTKSANIRTWVHPDPEKVDLIQSVTYIDTRRPAFKAKYDEMKRRGGQAVSEVMLWYPFKLESAADLLLTRNRPGGNDDHKAWLKESNNLFKAL